MPRQKKPAPSRYTKKLEELVETQTLLSSHLEPKDILSSLALSALALLDAESAEVWQSPNEVFAEGKSIRLALQTAEGLTAKAQPRAFLNIPGREVQKEKNEFFVTNLLPVLTKYFAEAPKPPLRKKQRNFSYGQSLLSCVFSIKQEMRGLITVSREEKRPFTPEDHYFLKRLATQAGICLGNGSDYQSLRRGFKQAERDLNFFKKQESLLGDSPVMQDLQKKIKRAAPSQASILILGERGTGKEIVANLLHQRSNRSGGPLVKINCAGLGEELLESELFGYEKGAFTGADQTRRGLFEAAHKGTLFLDEIAEMSPKLQARLLRALQSQSIRRVGGQEEIPVDVRLISATNREILADFDEKIFRRDLFDRIATIVIQTPPLRKHPEDIELLISYFLEKYKKIEGIPRIPPLGGATLEKLRNYDWPGNVRELENLMHRFVILQDEASLLALLPSKQVPLEGIKTFQKNQADSKDFGSPPRHDSILPQATRARAMANPPDAATNYQEAKTQFEKEFLLRVLEEFQGNLSRIARATGIDRSNLRGKLKKHNLRAEDFRS